MKGFWDVLHVLDDYRFLYAGTSSPKFRGQYLKWITIYVIEHDREERK